MGEKLATSGVLPRPSELVDDFRTTAARNGAWASAKRLRIPFPLPSHTARAGSTRRARETLRDAALGVSRRRRPSDRWRCGGESHILQRADSECDPRSTRLTKASWGPLLAITQPPWHDEQNDEV